MTRKVRTTVQLRVVRSGGQARGQMIEHIARVLMQLSWVAQKQFAQSIAEHKLTLPQFLTLAFLAKAPHDCAMSQVAEATHQDAATTTGVVDRLERLGLVERTRSEVDRRVVLVRPTREGEALLAAIKQTRVQRTVQLFASFDDQTLALLSEQLERLWQTLEAQARQGGDCAPPNGT